jgi:hypothetical protein
MTISEKAIDRLFHRLTATYGADFLGRYKGQTENDLKAVWMHELAGFENHLGALAWALENLPERAPNVIEFRNLARRAPLPEVPRLESPKADLARVNAELSKLGGIRKQLVNTTRPGLDWAYALKARDDAGEKLRPVVRMFYRQALRMES